MTIEEKKKWLSRALKKDEEIKSLLIAQQKSLELACNITSCVNEVNIQSSKKNSTEDKFIAYSDYSRMIDDRIDELCDIKIDILSTINKMQESTYRIVLINYYINGMTFEEISAIVKYSKEHIIRDIFPKALEQIKIEGV